MRTPKVTTSSLNWLLPRVLKPTTHSKFSMAQKANLEWVVGLSTLGSSQFREEVVTFGVRIEHGLQTLARQRNKLLALCSLGSSRKLWMLPSGRIRCPMLSCLGSSQFREEVVTFGVRIEHGLQTLVLLDSSGFGGPWIPGSS
jgi:hypothetical protein